ncbi:MAG: hypothetical protein C0407_11250, partial [Desulfobacca sp.]|nr:hypothetical protein [Desulfobacca sp.]
MAKAGILIAGDERIKALDVQDRLENWGYKILGIFSSAEEALKKAEELHPDLVLMDIVLTGNVTGIQATDRIRTGLGIPVIYLIAKEDHQTIESAKSKEPFGYLLKSFEERDLKAAIDMARYKHSLEQNHKERQQWLSTTLHSIGDGVIATDREGRITFMNPVAVQLTGWKQDEGLGQDLEKIFIIINEQTRQPAENPAIQALQSGTIVGLANHSHLISRTGREIPIDDSASPIRDEKGDIAGVVLIFRDISEKKKAQKALEESEHLLTNVFFSYQDGLSIMDLNLNIIRVNPTMEHWYPHAKPFAGKKCYQAYHNRREPCENCPSIRTIEKGRPFFEVIPRTNAREEPVGWLDMTSFPLIDINTGEIIGVVEYVRDITEKKKMEEQLHQEQARFKSLVEYSPMGLILIEKKGTFTYLNPKFIEIFGYQLSEIPNGQEWFRKAYPDQAIR